MLTRRYFIKGLALSTLASSTYSKSFAQDLDKFNLYSAASDNQGKHWLIITNSIGEIRNKLNLPARAHEVFKHPKLELLCVVARRPGKYISLVHAKTGSLIKTISPSKGHCFYGHGLFSQDGRFLVTSEQDIESGEGRVTVRDCSKEFKIAKQYSSHGIGPHEIKLSFDGKTLVVANGGINTRPSEGRAKLNLDTMQASLTYLEFSTGKLLEQRTLPKDLHQLSIRHIDINHKDQVVIAMQYQGDKTDQVPLMAIHTQSEEIRFLKAPPSAYEAMKHYCGSVKFDQSGQYAATSSPKGDLLTLWDISKGEFIDKIRCRDVCGIAALKDEAFIISNGMGKLYQYTIKERQFVSLSTPRKSASYNSASNVTTPQKLNLSWDNHLSISMPA